MLVKLCKIPDTKSFIYSKYEIHHDVYKHMIE